MYFSKSVLSVISLIPGILIFSSCAFFRSGSLIEGYFPLDLRQEANMGFMDDVPVNGKGGWFDDGPSADLRYFLVNQPAGEKLPSSAVLKGTPFRILDPAKNHGKSIVVFGTEERNQVGKRSFGPVKVGKRASALRFLHADGWGKDGCTVAECGILYEDGTKAFFTLKNGDNISDWYFPRQIPHAQIGWNGYSEHASSCGLYVTEWKLPHPEKVISSLSIRGSGKRMYALVAATFVEKNASPAGPDTPSGGITRPKIRAVEAPSKEGVNPNRFPEYRQRLDVVFKNTSDAKDSVLKAEPLPGKKLFAFTTRWDDCSVKHLRHAQIMHKYGFRGTFILNAFRRSYAEKTASQFLKLGHAAGNHSGRHQHFSKMTKNEVFENIVLQQVLIESALQTVSISFTFPFGIGTPDPEQRLLIGRVLNSAGIYCCPFTNQMNGIVLGLSPRKMFSTYLFHANDRRPEEALFEKGRIWAETLSLNNPDTPRITYGLHTMMDDEGFKLLEEIYKKYAGRKEYWYCNDNEYGSYRYSFYNASPEKVMQEGSMAQFAIRRYSPAYLGAETPLEISFTREPVSVRLDGIPLKRSKWGTYILPHSPGRTLPAAVVCLTREKESPRIPGIQLDLQMRPGTNTLNLLFRNAAPKAVTNLRCVILVPPRWKTMTWTFDADLLVPGETITKEIPLGIVNLRKEYEGKQYSFVCKIDFSLNGKNYRMYRILRTK